MMQMEKLDITEFKNYLKPRPTDAHKGMYGHVLVVGGDYGYSGAIKMAAEAALRVGAGLVSVATKPDIALTLNLGRPEIMCHGINSEKKLALLLDKATVVIVGPGMGQSSWAKKLFLRILKSKKPLVVDADALNILAKRPISHAHWILTPHLGEAARLLKTTVEEIKSDRISAIKELQKKMGGVCVLKGAGSLILAPGEVTPIQCEAGNPGMATAGMGDVLSGVIGGLAAQGFSLADAAKCGVLIHAMAGDLAASDGERGMLATDLLPHLRRLVNFH
jgi:hydroxyethylthiazole kinase-like uncharacterized protein yjeF